MNLPSDHFGGRKNQSTFFFQDVAIAELQRGQSTSSLNPSRPDFNHQESIDAKKGALDIQEQDDNGRNEAGGDAGNENQSTTSPIQTSRANDDEPPSNHSNPKLIFWEATKKTLRNQ